MYVAPIPHETMSVAATYDVMVNRTARIPSLIMPTFDAPHLFRFSLCSPASHPGDGVVDEEDEIIGGDVTRDGVVDEEDVIDGDTNGDGLVNSADTDIVGDTNGDGVVDENDTGLVADANGESWTALRLPLLPVLQGLLGSVRRSRESLCEVGKQAYSLFPGCWEESKIVFVSSTT